MTSFRAHPELGLPPSPRAVPVVDAAEATMALPGPATGRPFLLEAGPVRVTGTERGGVDRICLAGRPVLEGLTSSGGPAANVVATPGSLRRELVGPEGMLEETLMAVQTPGSAALQWRRRGAVDPLRLTLSFHLPCEEESASYRVGEDAVVVQPSEGDEAVVAVLSPPPGGWRVGRAEDGRLRVEAEVTSPDAVTLGVYAGPRISAATRTMEHLETHLARLLEAPSTGDTVRTVTGVGDMDEGLDWLSWRLAHAGGSPDAPAIHLLWWGLGSLAVGSPEAALRALAHLEERGAPEDAALLAARIALVTGKQDYALRYVDFRPVSAWGRVAAAALADALRYAASDDDIKVLRDAGSGAFGGGRMALPMAGESTPEPLPAWLSDTVAETRSRADSGTDLVEAAHQVAALAGHDPQAYGSWRGRLATGMAGGPGGRGTWDPGEPNCPAVAAALACGLVHGLLGWRPDAPVGRLGLAPSLPGHMRAFRATGLSLGDVRLDLAYERKGAEHRYDLTPTAGRVPATLIFEPAVIAGGLEEVSLDGAAVELDVRRARDRTAVSVQIPLDGPRVLLLRTAGEGREGDYFSSSM